MITEFAIISASTVPESYSWDYGVPLTGSNIEILPVISITTSVTGNAPGTKVTFKNNSITEQGFANRLYVWDFGDFYNMETNFLAVTCTADVEHTYVMPGTYDITLYHLQSRIRQDFDFTENATYCKGKYDIRWFWDNMLQLSATWDQTTCRGQYAKWWDNELACFGKYCKFWNWYDLQCASVTGNNPVTWEQTYSLGGLYPKRWAFEANDTICKVPQDATFIDTVVSNVQVYTLKAAVTVNEKSPEANLHCFTLPATGISPFTVQLTPRGSIPGSYPINRIVWNSGDGSPVKTVWRHKLPDTSIFTYTSAFSADPADPRNYDLIHTYKRSLSTYPIFYPSITVYSECTNTTDSCSYTLGPIELSSISSQTHLLNVQNINHNNLYAFEFNNSIAFTTTDSASLITKPNPNYPSHLIKNSNQPVPNITFKGNSTNVFPTIYLPQC